MSILIDTNIALYLFNGETLIAELLEGVLGSAFLALIRIFWP